MKVSLKHRESELGEENNASRRGDITMWGLTVTIAETREILWEESTWISDEQLQNLLDRLFKFCSYIIKHDMLLVDNSQ